MRKRRREVAEKVNLWERRLCFVDVETTGLNVFLGHELIQIGAVLVDPISLVIADEFERKVVLARPEKENPEARKFNRYDPAVWAKEAVPAAQAVREFGEFARGKILWGQDISFDWGFLLELATRTEVDLAAYCGIDLWDPPKVLRYDLATLTYEYLREAGLAKNLESTSLSKVGRFLGIEIETEHDALADARKSAEVYAAFRRRFAVIELAGS